LITILHAAVVGETMVFWGEAPGPDEPGVRGKGKRRSSARSDFPFDAGYARLKVTLQAMAVAFDCDARRMTLWAPTRGDRPLPSSELISESPDSPGDVQLAPWGITGLPLDPAETVDLLCACMDKHTVAPGVVVGSDLAFLAALLRYAGALVARQQFVPGLSDDGPVRRARWEPSFAGRDAERLARLAKAMPASIRAVSIEEKSVAPDAAPAAVISGFIAAMVDHLVRAGAVSTRRIRASRIGESTARTTDNIHDRWLHALQTRDGIIDGSADELSALARQLDEWRRPLLVTAAFPLRLCFRLDEPEEGSEVWRVHYLLQAADDPTLIVPVGQAWKNRGLGPLRRKGTDVHEHLLTALGQAACLSARIAASLEAQEPSGYETDAGGAHEFLAETAVALEAAGFGVMLPAWWTRKGATQHVALRANVKSPKLSGGAGLSLDRIIQFDWELALGDTVMSRRELEALAKLKAPLVRLRGQWVELDAEEIRHALDFWESNPGGAAPLRDILSMSLGVAPPVEHLPVERVTASGVVGEFLRSLEADGPQRELAPPDCLRDTLRPYQTRGYAWLAHLARYGLGACLADDMGLGKTLQTLALIQRDYESGSMSRPVLLVCPTSVIANWHKEAARFTPDLPVLVHHGVKRHKAAAFEREARQYALVVASYALLHRDLELLKRVDWAGVVLDEAQNIKNAETRQSRAARSLSARYRIALTGTPVENNVGDLWAIMEFLNPGFLGTQAAFKRNFFVPIQAGHDPEAAARLKRVTGPFILRRLKTDKSIITDLPEKMEMKVYCNLTKEQASLYAAVVKDAERALESAEGIERKGLVLATMMKLKQVCNHPAQLMKDNSAIAGRSGKLARLTEMLEEVMARGERALVFTQFTEMGDLLHRHLQETFGRELPFLHGGVPRKRRDRMIENFQSSGDAPPVFLLSLKAGGTGLNLTQASHVFHFDRWWNPAVENQATDRAFRIGQSRNVQVHKFICAGTMEERIDEMMERKQAVAEKVIGTGEAWLTELTNRELKEVFALREEAVAE
jgi:superfamily II DNA or RNA helicase